MFTPISSHNSQGIWLLIHAEMKVVSKTGLRSRVLHPTNFTWTLNTIYSTGGLPYWGIQCYDWYSLFVSAGIIIGILTYIAYREKILIEESSWIALTRKLWGVFWEYSIEYSRAITRIAGRLSLCYATLHWHDSRQSPSAVFHVDDFCKLVRLVDTGRGQNLLCVPESESCPLKIRAYFDTIR